MHKCYLIDSEKPQDASLNMAIDEILLNNISTINSPVIRIYLWEKIGFTCGAFQNDEIINSYKSSHQLKYLNRRPTGGGIVPHGVNDFTYSIILPKDHVHSQLQPRKLYLKIHEVILKLLIAYTDKTACLAHNNNVAKTPTIPKECFATPVENDVLINGEKVAGSAQKRSRLGILIQGSIQKIKVTETLKEDFIANMAYFISQNSKCITLEKDLYSTITKTAI